MFENGCGLLETPYNFFIDHLAPLCSFLGWPILSSNPQTKLLYQKYYPDVEIRLKNWNLNSLIKDFDSILYSFDPAPSFGTILRHMRKMYPNDPLWQKDLKLLFHFHGCSDKGFHSMWMDPEGHFNDLDLVFIYGQRMKDLLMHKKLHQLPKKLVETGNYRKEYYEKHEAFFDERVEVDLLSKFKRKKPLLLYAPTWQDRENSSSFFALHLDSFKALTKDFNVLIKLHPNMSLKREGYDPSLVLQRAQALSQIEDILVVPFYPLVYPLLKRADLYLGDFSSVGYDALAYPKPLIFLNALERDLNDPGAHLLKAGRVISKKEFNQAHLIIKEEFEKRDFFSLKLQQKLYNYAFKEIKFEKALTSFSSGHFLFNS